MNTQEKEEAQNSAKEVEYFAAIANAWVNTRIEHDKSLLTLSAGGVGLLITLLSTVGIKTTDIFIFFALAIISFVICLGAVLWIYKRNATHLEDVIKDDAKSDSLLSILDNVALGTFFIGVLSSSIAGFLIAAHSFTEKEKYMSSDNKQVTSRVVADSVNGIAQINPGRLGVAAASVNGISNLMPTQMAKSLNGIGGLNPASSGVATNQSVAKTPSASSGNSAQNKNK